MEDVIRQIIELEEKARNVIESTEDENEAKIADAKQALKDLESSILGSADQKIRQLRERELKECQEVIEAMAKECENKVKVMEVQAIEHEKEWVDYLVTQVLER